MQIIDEIGGVHLQHEAQHLDVKLAPDNSGRLDQRLPGAERIKPCRQDRVQGSGFQEQVQTIVVGSAGAQPRELHCEQWNALGTDGNSSAHGG